MEATDELYQQHLPLLQMAAKRAWQGRGQPESTAVMVTNEDLMQVGAEKWLAIVRRWRGEAGDGLRAKVYRSCLNAMLSYLRGQRLRSSRWAPEEAAANLEDPDQELAVGRVNMRSVHALPPTARQLVLTSLDLHEAEDGGYSSNGDRPCVRVPVGDLTVMERRRARKEIASALID